MVLVELEAPAELELELVHAELDVVDVLEQLRLFLCPGFFSPAAAGLRVGWEAWAFARVQFLVRRGYLHERVCEAFVLVSLEQGVFDAQVLFADLEHEQLGQTPQFSRFFCAVRLKFFAQVEYSQ